MSRFTGLRVRGWSWTQPLSRSPPLEASSGRRWLPVAEQRLPALALFPPGGYPRQRLEVTQVNRVAAPLGPRQEQDRFLNIGC